MPKNKSKLILVLVVEIASGKDTMADYLVKKYKFEKLSFSQPLRDILDILDLKQTRENMANLGKDLMNRFGQDTLSKMMANKISKDNSALIVLPNVRIERDIICLKELKGFKLVHIDVEQKTRYRRLTERGQNADDKTKTWKQFIKDGKAPYEISIREIAKLAKHKIDNNGSLEDFYKQIDELMSKIYV